MQELQINETEGDIEDPKLTFCNISFTCIVNSWFELLCNYVCIISTVNSLIKVLNKNNKTGGNFVS